MQNSALKDNLKDMVAVNKDLENDIEILINDMDGLKQEMEKMQIKFKDELQNYESTIQDLQCKLESSEKKNTECDKEKTELEKKLASLNDSQLKHSQMLLEIHNILFVNNNMNKETAKQTKNTVNIFYNYNPKIFMFNLLF